jgi:hypothetical protein
MKERSQMQEQASMEGGGIYEQLGKSPTTPMVGIHVTTTQKDYVPDSMGDANREGRGSSYS